MLVYTGYSSLLLPKQPKLLGEAVTRWNYAKRSKLSYFWFQRFQGSIAINKIGTDLVPSETLKTLMTVPLSLAVAILVPEGENWIAASWPVWAGIIEVAACRKMDEILGFWYSRQRLKAAAECNGYLQEKNSRYDVVVNTISEGTCCPFTGDKVKRTLVQVRAAILGILLNASQI